MDDAYLMNALSEYLTVLALFLVLAAPALVGHLHERRIDRQLKDAAQAALAARPVNRDRTRTRAQKSSSRSTVPSTATWYADGRRSKKLVSS
ncbi:Tfp pilus assembly protein FimT [Streptomyces sp. B4I13]|nr:Tfp pilus assembly protein FimT [Streptomyces sp. B4I13]